MHHASLQRYSSGRLPPSILFTLGTLVMMMSESTTVVQHAVCLTQTCTCTQT